MDPEARRNELVMKQTLDRVKARGWRGNEDALNEKAAKLLAALDKYDAVLLREKRDVLTAAELDAIHRESGCKLSLLRRNPTKQCRLELHAKKGGTTDGPAAWLFVSVSDPSEVVDSKRQAGIGEPLAVCIALVIDKARASELRLRDAALAAVTPASPLTPASSRSPARSTETKQPVQTARPGANGSTAAAESAHDGAPPAAATGDSKQKEVKVQPPITSPAPTIRLDGSDSDSEGEEVTQLSFCAHPHECRLQSCRSPCARKTSCPGQVRASLEKSVAVTVAFYSCAVLSCRRTN